MPDLSLQNPVFATYAGAASLMILKAVAMSWLTVVRMVGAKGGFRSPEDLRKTPLNPEPNPQQLEPNERVERIRRIQMNDLENLPFFQAAGFLFLFTDPSLTVARRLYYGPDPRRPGRPADPRRADRDLYARESADRRPGLLRPARRLPGARRRAK